MTHGTVTFNLLTSITGPAREVAPSRQLSPGEDRGPVTNIRLHDPMHIEMVREYAAILAFQEALGGVVQLPFDYNAAANHIAALIANDDIEHARCVYASPAHECIMLKHCRLDIKVDNGSGVLDFNICQTLAQRWAQGAR